MKASFLILLCALLAMAAPMAPKLATFQSPVPLCPPGETRPDCLPWRPTPPSPESPILSHQERAIPQDAALLPTSGAAPDGLLWLGGILFGLGMLLLGMARRLRSHIVRLDLVKLIQQVAPQVLGGDERAILVAWLKRNIEPGETVTIDLNQCAPR